MKSAMKAKDSLRLSVLRMLKSELKYKQIDLGRDLTEEDAIAVFSTAAKKRLEASEEYKKAGRDDLSRQELAEHEVVREFLPQQLSDGELNELVAQAIVESGASSIKDLGLVMKVLMPRVRGRADGKAVNTAVKAKLTID